MQDEEARSSFDAHSRRLGANRLERNHDVIDVPAAIVPTASTGFIYLCRSVSLAATFSAAGNMPVNVAHHWNASAHSRWVHYA